MFILAYYLSVWWTPCWHLLEHTQLKHDFSRFPIFHFWSKTPSDLINFIEIHTKNIICKIHQTSVSVAANASQPLEKWASPCSFGCSNMNLHQHQKKRRYFIWFYRYVLKSFISHISYLTTPLTKNDVEWKYVPKTDENEKWKMSKFWFWP